jgi:hypothetical protein
MGLKTKLKPSVFIPERVPVWFKPVLKARTVEICFWLVWRRSFDGGLDFETSPNLDFTSFFF